MLSRNNFARWLDDYDCRRTGGTSNEVPSEYWQSCRYDFTQPWAELSQIEIPNFDRGDGKGNHTIGSAIRNLKRLWKSYKLHGKYGGDRRNVAFAINEIQFVLGLPLTEMVDSHNPDWVREQLELQYGKQEEQNELAVDSDDEEDYDYQLSKQKIAELKREEAEETSEQVNKILGQMGIDRSNPLEDY